MTTDASGGGDGTTAGGVGTGRIGFVFAMPMEARPFVRRLRLRRVALGGLPAWDGRLPGGRPVTAVVTGMGTALATAGCRRLLDERPVERAVVVGITGAVENVTPIGTVVRPEAVVHSGTGRRYRPHPLGPGQPAPAGVMWTTDEIINEPEAIGALRAQGVVCLDMETAAVAGVCEERGIPWSVIRVISDRATDGSVDPEVFRMSNQDGTPNPRAVLRYFAAHPGRLPVMARLARGASRATSLAAREAIEACSAL